ncbi:uncharacterized protein LOC142526063 [Primulina tabacum]|uniref:uncharacterized protein LOC142526063 n=1 Tax=Primulina tabacum TaxID=48773 RepID=UPI003F5A58CE
MENSEAKRMLDICILEYMIQKKMSHTAVVFAQEANVRLDAPMTKKEFLEEWWNMFFEDICLSGRPTNPEAMEVSSLIFSTDRLNQNATDQNAANCSQNIRLELPRPLNHMLQNTSPTMGMPGIQDSFPNACQEHLQTMGMPGIQDSFPKICQEHLQITGAPGIQDSFPNACLATQNRGNLSEDVLLELSWREMSYLLQNREMEVLYNHPHSTATPRPTMVDFRQRALPMSTPPSPNMLKSAHPMMTTPSPNMANLPQSALPTTAQGQKYDQNHLGSRSSLDSNAGNLTAESRQGREHPTSRGTRGKTRFITAK